MRERTSGKEKESLCSECVNRLQVNELLICSGGIRLTVTGENLNSVSNPVLSIIQEIKDGGGLVEKEEYTSVRPCAAVQKTHTQCQVQQTFFNESLIVHTNYRTVLR